LDSVQKPGENISVYLLVIEIIRLRQCHTSKKIDPGIIDILVNPIEELQQYHLPDGQDNEYTFYCTD
jgi:hypothetical protein